MSTLNEEESDVPEAQTWWSRPCGGREVLRVAAPLVLSSLSWTLLTFIDRMFLAWHSKDALAASFPAALLWWTSICLPLGICMYVGTFVSQSHGAKRHNEIGPYVWQGVWVGLAATPAVLLVVPLSPMIFQFAGHAERVIESEIIYYSWLNVGTPAMMIAHAMSSFYTGRGRTWVVMVIDCSITVVNIILDYGMIFGHLGFPAMGIKGAALSTAIAYWLRVGIYLFLILRSENRRCYATHQFKVSLATTKRLLYFGIPSGLQMFLEVAGFTSFVFLVGRLGVAELAATNLAFNVSSVAFMPVFGLATTASILVGQELGRNDPVLASRATWTTLCIACGYIGSISLLYVVIPDVFLYGFFAINNEGSSDQIRSIAIVLLRYVAAYNLFDAMNLVFAHAVKGAGDTHFVSIASLAMATLLAVGTWYGMQQLQFGLHECWILLTAWITMLGLVYYGRFLQGKWKAMRVLNGLT